MKAKHYLQDGEFQSGDNVFYNEAVDVYDEETNEIIAVTIVMWQWCFLDEDWEPYLYDEQLEAAHPYILHGDSLPSEPTETEYLFDCDIKGYRI